MHIRDPRLTHEVKQAEGEGWREMTEDWDALADDEQEWGAPTRAKGRDRHDTVVTVRLPSALADAARELAEFRGTTLSAFVRDLAIEEIAKSRVNGYQARNRSWDLSSTHSLMVTTSPNVSSAQVLTDGATTVRYPRSA